MDGKTQWRSPGLSERQKEPVLLQPSRRSSKPIFPLPWFALPISSLKAVPRTLFKKKRNGPSPTAAKWNSGATFSRVPGVLRLPLRPADARHLTFPGSPQSGRRRSPTQCPDSRPGAGGSAIFLLCPPSLSLFLRGPRSGPLPSPAPGPRTWPTSLPRTATPPFWVGCAGQASDRFEGEGAAATARRRERGREEESKRQGTP